MNQSGRQSRAALVTGGARRIGRAIAYALAEDGWDVAVHYRSSREDAESLVRELRAHGVHAMAVFCDLENAAAVAELVPQCVRQLGTLSLLVNNASLFEYDDIASFEPALWDRHSAVNLRAPLMLSQALQKQLPDGVAGCIINMLDQKIFNLNPDFLSYTVTRMGLEGATRALAMALAPRVRVCGIAPGLTLPPGTQSEESFRRAHRLAPLGKSSEVEDIVQAVRYLANAKAVTGVTIAVDGGQHLLPLKRDIQFEVR
jgi:NAD(P)-dependent dehydrogenase (short-subunit alcohol dehydrogenase family)